MSAPSNPRAGSIALAFAVALCACSKGREEPRHVLLIVVDTLRADHLTPYGYEHDTSPRLAELAEESVVFEWAISQASFTTPSMVSLHTGSYVAKEALTIPEDKATLAEAFQKGGYATGAFIYNNMLNAENHFGRGYDYFEYKDPPYGTNENILGWIGGNKDGNCFTYVHLNEAHDPYESKLTSRFSDARDGLDAERLAYFEEVRASMNLVDHEESLALIDEEIGRYDDDVFYSDHRIGQILDAVRETDLWDRTTVVVAADHGEGLWTRLLFQRAGRYADQPETLANWMQMTHGAHAHAEIVHVPLILRSPDLPAGRVSSVVENIDVASTLLELCDLPAPTTLQGKSLVPLAQGVKPAEPLYAFSFTRFNTTVVTGGCMQLIEPTDLGRCSYGLQTQLYDLKQDPRARRNIVSEHPDLVAELQEVGRGRLERGISTSQSAIGLETRLAINQLGYLESGVVESISSEMRVRSVDGLIEEIENVHQSCLVRWEAAKALESRPLDKAQRQRLEAARANERSPAVRDALEKSLG